MGLIFESYSMDIIAIIIAILCTIISYFKYAFTYWSRKGVAYVPPSIPFGNAGAIIRQEKTGGENTLDLYKQLKSPGRRYAGLYMFHKPELLILDPELVKNIMAKDFNHFTDRGIQYDEENDPLTAHLVALSGIKWKNLRQKLTPTFTSGKMKLMFQTLIGCSNELEVILNEYVEKSDPIDIKDIVGRFTTDIIGSCAFGLECNSLKDPNAEFRKFGKKVFEPNTFQFLKRMVNRFFPVVFKTLKLKRTNKEVHNFFMKVVKETVEYREKNSIKRNDFMQLLINIRNTGDADKEESEEPGKSLTMEEVAAQAFLFFLAGFETSSTTMTFFFYDMAMHQDIQNKVRKEINDMLEKYNGNLTYEGIMELQYLDKALNESMRLHAAIPMLVRRCTKEYKVPDSDLVLEEGLLINIPVYGFQSDPEYYPEPAKYDPERFSNEEKSKRHPFTFLPFGEGPRNCIGLRFGLLQTKVGLIVLLKNHKFTLNSKTQTPIKMDPSQFIFSVQGGIWLNAEKSG